MHRADWALRAIVALWLLWTFTWLVWAGFAKRAKRVEALHSRVIQGLLGGAGGLLLVAQHALPLGPLDARLWPRTQVTRILAVGLVAAGLGFAVWARAVLGRNWSGRVTLKEDHELVEAGPYALVRNPIYTGILTALSGVVALLGQPRGLLGLAAFAATFVYKVRVEESFLEAEFGERFLDYRRRVKSLIPFVA